MGIRRAIRQKIHQRTTPYFHNWFSKFDLENAKISKLGPQGLPNRPRNRTRNGFQRDPPKGPKTDPARNGGLLSILWAEPTKNKGCVHRVTSPSSLTLPPLILRMASQQLQLAAQAPSASFRKIARRSRDKAPRSQQRYSVIERQVTSAP